MLATKNPVCGVVSKESEILKPAAILADVGAMRSAAQFKNLQRIESGGGSFVISRDNILEGEQDRFQFASETIRRSLYVAGAESIQPLQ